MGTGSGNQKAVIFDLDGVLVDTAAYHFRAWKRLADELGIPFTEEDNERLKGVSRMQSLEIILELGDRQPSDGEKQELADRKNGYYQDSLRELDADDILPGAVDLVRALRAKGIKTAMASGSKNAPRVVETLGLGSLFDAQVSGHDIERSKPDPQLFLIAAERLGEKPENCIVVEDAEAGVEAAHRGGMKAVGIGSVEQLGAAERVVSGLDEITADEVLAL